MPMRVPTIKDVALAHVAVGGNAASNALSRNRALAQCVNLSTPAINAAFAAKNSVAIVARDAVSPSSTSSLLRVHTLLQHCGATRDATRITSVYLHAPPDATSTEPARVLAGDSEGNVLLWLQSSDGREQWSEVRTLRPVTGDHDSVGDAAVSAVTAVRTRRRWLYFAAFSSGHVAVWEQLHTDDPTSVIDCVAVVSLGVRQIMETLAAIPWTNQEQEQEQEDEQEQDVLVAAGGVDSKVHLFELARDHTSLTPLIALEGHRGWVRAVDFEPHHSSSASSSSSSRLLASASQDHRVRLWKISGVDLATTTRDVHAAASSAGFHAVGATTLYTVSFDALLIAHEDWVTSLAWTLLPRTDRDSDDAAVTPVLVSTSMDNTVILWKKNARVGASGAWVPTLRVGEHGGNGVLASAVLPTPDARVDLLALNLTGQLERWTQQPAPSTTFLPAPSLTGHTAPVTDLSWAPRGDYLLSLSLDQTTRVLAPWRAHGSWHEISRAQVHGYDLNCGAFLKQPQQPTSRNDRFVCGADEKILRVFEAPDDLQTLVKAMNGDGHGHGDETRVDADAAAARVEHAYLPELSLTNKSTEKTKHADQATISKPSSSVLGAYATLGDDPPIRVPVGDTLAKKTLWPELRKLYGHGNELLCVASNHAGTLLASACKSREEKFAAVWLWRTHDWSAATPTPLDGHKSSVVQLAFSPDDHYLLSVSKDRHFCVFRKQESNDDDNNGAYVLTDRVKAHKRIIWSCAWAPDATLFATGARDQTVALWGRATVDDRALQWTQRGTSIAFESAVTAVAFAPWQQTDQPRTSTFFLAVGLETGAIYVYAVTSTDATVVSSLAATIPRALTPTAAISRLSWAPASANETSYVFASASADHSVRLYNVQLEC